MRSFWSLFDDDAWAKEYTPDPLGRLNQGTWERADPLGWPPPPKGARG